jgi:hypothetical protein
MPTLPIVSTAACPPIFIVEENKDINNSMQLDKTPPTVLTLSASTASQLFSTQGGADITPISQTQQQVVLIIQAASGALILDSPSPNPSNIGYDTLLSSTVSEFFAIYSLKSGMPLHLISSLVFNFIFAPEARENDMTVHQGNGKNGKS